MTHTVTATLGFADFRRQFQDRTAAAAECAQLEADGWLDVTLRDEVGEVEWREVEAA